jgi:type II secretion system protein I/type II secretion system protein J
MRGFTLLEVLVALVIVGTALGASLRAVGSLTQNSDGLRTAMMATWSAENRLVQMRLSKTFPAVGKQHLRMPAGRLEADVRGRSDRQPESALPPGRGQRLRAGPSGTPHHQAGPTGAERMRQIRAPRRGFTLIELLVAITILAMVAVLGWRGLDGIIRSRGALTAQMEQTRGMQLAFAQMQSDCENLATPALLRNRDLLQADDNRITMVRMVLAENQPSRLQVVSYRVRDGVLTRRESASTRDLQQLDACGRRRWRYRSRRQRGAAIGRAEHEHALLDASGTSSATSGGATAAGARRPACRPPPPIGGCRRRW